MRALADPAAPLPALVRGVAMARVDGSLVVLDPRKRRLLAVSDSVGVVMAACDGTTAVDQLVRRLITTYDIDANRARSDVDEALELLRASELFTNGEHDGEVEAPTVATLGALPEGIGGTRPRMRCGEFRAGRVVIGVQCDDPALAHRLRAVLASLATPAHATRRLDVWSRSGVTVALDGALVADDLDGDRAVAMVMSTINRLAVVHNRDQLLVHAAAVDVGGRAILLPAHSNSGKSTLAAALLRAGFSYLTDEVAMVDAGSGRITGYPKPISLDPGAQALLPDLRPRETNIAATRWYLDPSTIGSAVERSDLGLVIIPKIVPGRAGTPRPLESADVLAALVANSFNIEDHAEHMAQLAGLAERCHGFELRCDALDVAVEAIAALAAT